MLALNCNQWGTAKEFADKNNLPLSFYAYRARMKEIENLGYATSKPIDPLKKSYQITESGKKIVNSLLLFFEQLKKE